MTARPPDWYCGAQRRSGGTCGHRAGYGTDHVGVGRCKFHGGATPNQRKRALEEAALRDFTAWREARGVHDSGGPVEVMTRILAEADDWYTYLLEILGGLHKDGWQHEGKDGALHLSVYVSLFERAQERAFKMAGEFAKLGIAERLARITERQGEAIIAVLVAVVDDLELGDDRRQLALERAGHHLSLLAGGLPS